MGQILAPRGARAPAAARCIGITGPFLSGKTTLLEAILARTGSIPRQGSVTDKTSLGDAAAESRDHGMSTEANIADTTFLEDPFTFVDLPGSIEFQAESAAILPACDAVIVVCEPDPKRVPALQIILKSLKDQNIPHLLFLNKMDAVSTRVRDIIPMLQPASSLPLVLRQIPIWNGGTMTGYVDLASERAFVYRDGAPSEVIAMPAEIKDRELEARFAMLEKIADFDDRLMEQLLSDQAPERSMIFDDLAKELRDGLICPVFLGSALQAHGIVRLLKALRHEAPTVAETARRLGLEKATSAAHVMKTIHSAHGGKTSVVRVLKGEIADSTELRAGSKSERVAGINTLFGATNKKRGTAKAGDTVGLGRLENVMTGDCLTNGRDPLPRRTTLPMPAPVYGMAIELKDKKDEVKFSAAITRLAEEDPALRLDHTVDTHQIVLWGQGEMHLRITLERLKRKYGIDVTPRKRQVPYKETIRGATQVRGRHKKQTGGHGQFGDVLIDIKPLPRGAGFAFDEKIHGGTVPKNYIPSVEIGVKDYLTTGPLGFPVVDLAVTLLDGSYHSVDSSDMAFRQAGRLAMSEGLPKCQPVLLEPIMAVKIFTPNDATARITAIVTQRRGQLLGYSPRDDWPGWDVVEAQMPESEMTDLIVDIRSATSGVGTYQASFDHLHELTGKIADQIVAAHRAA